MANYSVAGNKIKFKNPMLIEGNLPDEPQDDALDPVAQYREEQMRQLGGQGAAPSGKPDLAKPHPESMAGIKAANGGKIPEHLQRKKPIGAMSGNGPVSSPDKYDSYLRGNGAPGGAASRPELPDSGTASTAFGDSGGDNEVNSEQAMPWDQTDYNRVPSNVGQENEPNVTPVDPDTRTADLQVNPGFTPYYESETGKGVKEQGRQRLQEYLQKLAGRGKQHEERLAHDNDAAGAKARNDFGALLMDSASMVGTLGGKRADTAQLAQFPGKLYQADMAPSKSAMMYENAEDKDFKSLADIGDRQERNDILRSRLQKELAKKRQNIPGMYRPEKDGRPGGILSRDENGNLVSEDVPSGYAPIERPGQENLQQFEGLTKDGKPVAAFKDRRGNIKEAQIPPDFKFDPKSAKAERPPTEKQSMFKFYGDAAKSDLPLIEELESKYKPGYSYEIGNALPNIVGRHITSENDKRYAGAMTRFLDNLLHAATGAGFNETEVRGKLQGFSVQPGEPQRVIADKHAARRAYVQHILNVAGESENNTSLPPELFPPPKGPRESELDRAKAEKARRMEAKRGGQQ